MLNLASVLASLNLRHEEVVNNIVDPYYFSDEADEPETGPYTNINDGGNDMYDEANLLNTNLTQLYDDIKDDDVNMADSIPYTHTQAPELNPDTGDDWDNDYTEPPMDGAVADGSSYFGAGSQYFTNMYPDMFVMGATGINIDEFSITGNIGADGSGEYEVNQFTLTGGGRQFTCFNKQVYDSGDPSINHFIFVPGNGAGIDHLYDDENEDDDDCLQNLTGIDEIYYLLVATQEDYYMDESERLAIAQSFLDIITSGAKSTEQAYLQPIITFRVNAYDPTKLIGQLPPDGNIQNIINQLETRTIFIPGWPNALKHGDRFTLYGQAASDLKRKLPQLNVGETIIEIAPEEPNVVYLFANDKYVDYVLNNEGSEDHEVNNLMASMSGFSVNHTLFTSVGVGGWIDATENADIIMIPEMEISNLTNDLSVESKNKIKSFVSQGGMLILFGDDSNNYINLMNTIFNFSISSNGVSTPINLTVDGGQLFSSLESVINDNDATRSLDTSTLPVNSVTIYEGNSANESVVAKIPSGSGAIYVLGWDWYGAKPNGNEDGGWLKLLEKILKS